MHPCPCCGFRTLPSRGAYELCPVCWWEDDGGEPWDYSFPNGRTAVEAQQAFLAVRRPYRLRGGNVPAPRKREARDPGWRPYEVTAEVRARVDGSHESARRMVEEIERRADEELARNPEGPFKAYNADLRKLGEEAPTMTRTEVGERYRELLVKHEIWLPELYVELTSHLLMDEYYYRRHPLRAAWWLIRDARPGHFRRRWHELTTGSFTFAG